MASLLRSADQVQKVQINERERQGEAYCARFWKNIFLNENLDFADEFFKFTLNRILPFKQFSPLF